MNRFLRFVVLPTAIVVFACRMWAGVEELGNADVPSADILSKYLETEQSHPDPLRGASMDVEIDASVPKLRQQGRLHAMRRISKVGTVTYHAITFQGDNAVKHQVIARYLDAERQAQSNPNMKLTPENYKFRFKGERATGADRHVYVFEVVPRHKRVGLFKGEMWLDAATYLPVYEKGRLVKNPSIFFKRVDFERAYAVDSGVAVPIRTASIIKTRLVGKVELNVSYSNFEPDATDSDSEAVPASAGLDASRCFASVQDSLGPHAPTE